MITAACGDLEMKLQGHAGFAPAGEDLVCAGVTTLCYALAQTVANLAQEGLLQKPPTLELAPGQAHIAATPLPHVAAYLKGAFRTAAEGMRLLAKQYPKSVRLESEAPGKI